MSNTRSLTNTQRKALAFMAEKPRGETSGYDLKRNRLGNTGTLKQLSDRGYCTPVGAGHIAFPANGTWRITQSGRDALN